MTDADLALVHEVHEILERPAPLVWTKTPPAEPGWYWRTLPKRKDTCIVHVFLSHTGSGILCVSRDGVSAYPLHGGDGIGHYEWAGPIPMPREP